MNHVEMMRLAEKVALQSVCKRAQVGAVVRFADPVRHNGYCIKALTGYNHNADPRTIISTEFSCCEGEDGRTLPTVVHAEADALHGASGYTSGATLYVTRQPCVNCARLIVDAGISAVYYRDADDKTDGIEHLVAHGVFVSSAWLVGESWADRWQE